MTSVILSELWKKQQGELLISTGKRVEKGFVLTQVVSMYSLFEYILWNFLAFVDTEVFLKVNHKISPEAMKNWQ